MPLIETIVVVTVLLGALALVLWDLRRVIKREARYQVKQRLKRKSRV
jgi:type II secretory pathway pseudopilin PulG